MVLCRELSACDFTACASSLQRNFGLHGSQVVPVQCVRVVPVLALDGVGVVIRYSEP